VTIRDVARRAGVSVATVSRYLNQSAPVSDEVASRLEAALSELHYIPHVTARNLATKRTRTIGLLSTDLGGDFFAPLLSGIEAAASENGYFLLISSLRHPRDDRSLPPIGPHNTDGILAFTDSLEGKILRWFNERRFPVVLIHHSPPADLQIPCVTVENKAASRKIIEHLIESHDRKKIIFLRGPANHEDSYWRELGYNEALEAHGIARDPAWIAAGEFNREAAYQSIKRLIASGVEFDAVFSGDDEAAVGVLTALKEMEKRVPEDVSVVGFDDLSMSPYLTPPLTTVRAPTERVGYTATLQLISLIQTGQATLLTLLPTEVIIRRTCGCK
jgi:DNA-binding LacI/PurR family transcriptional regulator